ncbi:uncharacterized protein [Battus philenor]|uniref:uncharacterized protein n=1 Tax=Battus philenor TaxID=42288 RepID=UPI0035CFCB78
MYTDVPSFTRCCFCAPLRYGLLVWAYLKLVLSILLLAGFLMWLSVVFFFIFFSETAIYILMSFIITVMILVFDVVFNFVFVIGIHKRHTTLLHIYFRYGIAYVVLMITFFLVNTGFIIYFTYEPLQEVELWRGIAVAGSALVTILGIHSYLLLLLRSEIRKLKDTAQFKFENHTADPKCYMQQTDYVSENNKSQDDSVKTPLP